MTIGVIVLTYNFENYIRECIQSIIFQSIQPEKVVIVDDFSSDLTYKLAKKEIRDFKNFEITQNRFKKNKHNSINQLNCIKTGLECLNTDYVFLLDGDDYWDFSKIFEYKKVLAHQNPDLIFDCIEKFNGTSSKREIIIPAYFSSNYSRLIANHLELSYFLTPQTSALGFKRNILKYYLEQFSESHYQIWPDIQLGRRVFLSSKRNSTCIQKYLTKRRIHSLSDSQGLKDYNRWQQWKKQNADFFGWKVKNNKWKIIKLFALTIWKPKFTFDLIRSLNAKNNF